jgi:hypothetical protein
MTHPPVTGLVAPSFKHIARATVQVQFCHGPRNTRIAGNLIAERAPGMNRFIP